MPVDLSGVDFSALSSVFPAKPKRNPIIAGVSSGIDQLQGLGYNALAAGADAVGLNRARDWLVDRALINQDEAYASGRPDLERVEDQDLSTALPFAAYQISKQFPQIATALGVGALTGGAGLVPAGLSRAAASLPSVVGGGGLRAGADFAARRAALQAGERFAGNLTGGVGLGSVMGAGALYGESVDAGDPSPYAALAGAIPYGLTEGLSTAVLGGMLRRGPGGTLVDQTSQVPGGSRRINFGDFAPLRMLQAGSISGLGGAASELAQNEMEMAFNPTLSPEEIASRRLNSAVVGGLAEGAFGSLGGLRRPPQPTNLLPNANTSEETQQLPRLLDGQQQGSLFDLGTEGTVSYLPQWQNRQTTDVGAEIVGLRDRVRALTQGMISAEQAGNVPQFYQFQSAYQQAMSRLQQLEQIGQPISQMNDERQMSLALGSTPQLDLFGNPVVEAPVPQTPQLDTQPAFQNPAQLDMFEQTPTAMVRTEFGTPQIRAALRYANGGKLNAQLQRFIPEFSRALEQGPEVVQAVLAKFDNKSSTLSGDVFTTAQQIAADYQSRMVNAMAAEGLSRAQPGRAFGVAPISTATQTQMRERNVQDQQQAQQQQAQDQLAGAITDTDARVAGGDQQRSAQARREVLDSVLGGAANGGNARNRFIKALRKQGFKDTIIRPEEQQAIDRFFRNKAIDRYFAPVDQDPDVIPSAPNEMGDLVPEKVEPEPQRGKPKRVNENRSFRLTPPPSTEEDLAALEKARAKRERKAGGQPQAEPEQPQGTDRRQGILFTKKGAVSKAADQTEKTDAVQEPSAAPVPPRKRARTGPEVGEKVPGEGQAAAEGQAAKKPRKAKVKAKVGDTEVELEIENPEQKLEAIRNDIDKFKRFVACLRRK